MGVFLIAKTMELHGTDVSYTANTFDQLIS